MAALEKGRTMKGGAFHNYKVVVTGHSLGKIFPARSVVMYLCMTNDAPSQ